MSCLTMRITLQPAGGVIESIPIAEQARLRVQGVSGSHVSVSAIPIALMLGLSQVCSVHTEDMNVLAASDMILRTRDGGYILLNES